MKKRLLHQLVLASYTKETLDGRKVAEISTGLNKQDVKAYIRALKLMEQSKKIYLAMPKSSIYNTTKKAIQKLFPEKNIVFTENPSLLLGMRIIDNDLVYEVSLQNRLEHVLEEIEQQYEQ